MPNPTPKETHQAIMQLYDHAEKAVDLIEKYSEESAPLIPDVEKVVEAVEKNCDIMLDYFGKYVKSGKPLSDKEKLIMLKAKTEIDAVFESLFAKVGLDKKS